MSEAEKVNKTINNSTSFAKEPTNKLKGKIDARLRYFTSQITNIPGPKATPVRNLADEMQKEKRDTVIFQNDKHQLKTNGFYGSYYQ